MKENNLELMELFTKLEWLLRRLHLANHRHHGPMGDSSRGQGRVLAILKMQPEISQKELTYLLDMRPQSLGELLTKLEKNGYILRTPSETDRRVMDIKLTEEGKNATIDQETSSDKLFECLSEEEQENLKVYLKRIIESLETEVGDDTEGDGELDFDLRLHRGNPYGRGCERGFEKEFRGCGRHKEEDSQEGAQSKREEYGHHGRQTHEEGHFDGIHSHKGMKHHGGMKHYKEMSHHGKMYGHAQEKEEKKAD